MSELSGLLSECRRVDGAADCLLEGAYHAVLAVKASRGRTRARERLRGTFGGLDGCAAA